MISIQPQNDHLATDGIEFAFREVRTAQEMRDVLALRYRVYVTAHGTAHHDSLDHASRLDADSYDLVARHFALFARCGRRESVVGTLRFVSDRPSPHAALLHAVSAAHPTVAARFEATRPAPLPMLSYLDQAKALGTLVTRWAARGERVVEAGRLAVDPRVLLAAGRRGSRLSHHMVLSAIAVAGQLDPVDRVLIDAEPFLERLYTRFGFSRLDSLPIATRAAANVRYVLLEATPAAVPTELLPRVHAIARELRARGEAVMPAPNTDALPAEAALMARPEPGPARVVAPRSPARWQSGPAVGFARAAALAALVLVGSGCLAHRDNTTSAGMDRSSVVAAFEVSPEPFGARGPGCYAYLDADGKALNVDRHGSPRPATRDELRRAQARSFCSFGDGGNARSLRDGAMCLMPSRWPGDSIIAAADEGRP